MYIKRDLEDKLAQYLKSPEIIAIFGPRQSGKTTLLKNLLNQLDNAIYLTLEDIELKILFEEDIKNFVKLYIDPYQNIIIDEIQYAREGGKQLKYIFDTKVGKKIFVSGSSVMELSINTIKYLSGRIFVFNLYPFNFYEYLLAKDKALYEILASNNIKSVLSEPLIKSINNHIDDYCIYGGYPRVVLSTSGIEKKEVLKNLLNIYLLKDIKDLIQIIDERQMYKLLKLLSTQIGNMVVYEEISTLTQISAQKLKNYLAILEKAFLIKLIQPFFTNKRSEIVKNPKLYFIDNGLRNILINDFNTIENRTDKGAIYENFIFSELINHELEVKYYRTKSQAEIDFILNDKITVEVKSSISNPTISKSLRAYIEKYKPEYSYILNRSYQNDIMLEQTKVRFRPHFFARMIN